MDPLSLIMFGLIAVLIFFMFRNGKKRQQAAQEMQSNLQPGADVMLQSGIFGTVISLDDEDNRVTIRTGDASIVVHRNAVSQIVTPVEVVEESADMAPDDDPKFGQHFDGVQGDADRSSDDTDEGDAPKA